MEGDDGNEKEISGLWPSVSVGQKVVVMSSIQPHGGMCSCVWCVRKFTKQCAEAEWPVEEGDCRGNRERQLVRFTTAECTE